MDLRRPLERNRGHTAADEDEDAGEPLLPGLGPVQEGRGGRYLLQEERPDQRAHERTAATEDARPPRTAAVRENKV